MIKKSRLNLNPRDRLWVYLYVTGMTGRDAARQAYKITSQSALDLRVHRNMSNPAIVKLIAEIEEKIHGTPEQYTEKAKLVIAELELLSFYHPKVLFKKDDKGQTVAKDIMEMGDEGKLISDIEIEERYIGDVRIVNRKYKLHSKIKSLELLGKHHKLYTDVLDHRGKVAVAPEIYLPDN